MFRAAGGEIRTEVEVATLKLDTHRRAAGVVLTTGEEFDSGTVLSNADPKRTLSFVPKGSVPQEFIEDIDIYPSEGTVVKVNCALSGLPKFRGIGTEGTPGPEHMGTISVAPSIDYLETAARSAAEGRPSDQMFCEAWIQTASEPELAPEGKHTLSVFAQYAPYTLAEGTWGERRDQIGDSVLANLERYAPGLTDLVENLDRARSTRPRRTLRAHRRQHLPRRDPAGADLRQTSGERMASLPASDRGFLSVWLGSASGRWRRGAPGRNAARVVLEDFVSRGIEIAG